MRSRMGSVANELINKSIKFDCNFAEAWSRHMPNYITNKYNLEELQIYITERHRLEGG